MLPGVGVAGQEKIRNAKVAVVGCGGLGCPTLLYLASAGVGTIGIIDFDTVSITNLHRQVLFGNEDVGKIKIEVAKEKINRMHPEVNVINHPVMLDETNSENIFRDYDIIIDGCDNFITRYIVNDACVKLNKPLVYGSILGSEGQVATFNYKNSKNLRDLFPEPPNAEDVPDCSENGVLATIPGIIGTMMANECLKVIFEKDVSVNKFMIVDCLSMKISSLNY
ncbi:MAG: UBA/THIF-type binding protein [Bacteroidetes bacterium]|nr:UBA/THIF-type binding protein [Bacteroidota bacterium]